MRCTLSAIVTIHRHRPAFHIRRPGSACRYRPIGFPAPIGRVADDQHRPSHPGDTCRSQQTNMHLIVGYPDHNFRLGNLVSLFRASRSGQAVNNERPRAYRGPFGWSRSASSYPRLMRHGSHSRSRQHMSMVVVVHGAGMARYQAPFVA